MRWLQFEEGSATVLSATSLSRLDCLLSPRARTSVEKSSILHRIDNVKINEAELELHNKGDGGTSCRRCPSRSLERDPWRNSL